MARTPTTRALPVRSLPAVAGKAPKSSRALTSEEGATLVVLVDPARSHAYPDGRVLQATASHSASGALARFGMGSGASPARAEVVGRELAYRYGLELVTVSLSALVSVATAEHGGRAESVAEPIPDLDTAAERDA